MKSIIEKVLSEKEWDPYLIKVVENKSEHLVYAHISKNSWNITIEMHPELERLLYKTIKEFNNISPQKLAFSEGTIEDLLYACTDHEIGHWEHCPFDKKYGEEIFSGICGGLRSSGFSEEKTKTYATTCENMFSDIIVNVINSLDGFNNARYKNGESVFYIKEGMTNSKGFSDAYAIFVDIQSKITKGRKDSFRDIAEFFSTNYERLKPDIVSAIGTFLDSTTPESIFTYGPGNIITEIVAEFKNKGKWYNKAFAFGALMAKYVEGMTEEIKPSCKELGKKEKERIIEGAYKNNILVHSFEHLDRIYRERSGEIKVDYSVEDVSSRFPIRNLRRIELAEDSMRNLDLSSTSITHTEGGTDIQLFRGDVPILIEKKNNHISKYIPDLNFIIDSSASMSWDVNAGEGEYDILLRSIYSIFNHLEKHNKAFNINYSVLNFAGQTFFSGWHNYYAINEAKRLLFVRAGDGTIMDTTKVEELCRTKERFLSIMVSDGALMNLDESVEALHRLIERGNELALINIGNNNEFSARMAHRGADVHHVYNKEDIPKIMLKKTKAAYGG